MPALYNLPALKRRRRALRAYGTHAEALLWLKLKNRQVGGRRFRRQFSVGGYVLDFYCPSERLAIELDGGVHLDPARAAYDLERQRALETLGLRVVRVPNDAVRRDVRAVLTCIARRFGEAPEPLRPSGTSPP